jgi:hypothetical protein
MTRAELLEAASGRLTQAALLLADAGEDRFAADAEELAERVDRSQVPLPAPPDRTPPEEQQPH